MATVCWVKRGNVERWNAPPWALGNPILLLRPPLDQGPGPERDIELEEWQKTSKEFKIEGRKKGPWMGGIIGNGNNLNFPFC